VRRLRHHAWDGALRPALGHRQRRLGLPWVLRAVPKSAVVSEAALQAAWRDWGARCARRQSPKSHVFERGARLAGALAGLVLPPITTEEEVGAVVVTIVQVPTSPVQQGTRSSRVSLVFERHGLQPFFLQPGSATYCHSTWDSKTSVYKAKVGN
jgi:hypothetical protein